MISLSLECHYTPRSRNERNELICHIKDQLNPNIVKFIIVEAKEIHVFTVNLLIKENEAVSTESFEVNREIPRMYNNINVKKVDIEDIDDC